MTISCPGDSCQQHGSHVVSSVPPLREVDHLVGIPGVLSLAKYTTTSLDFDNYPVFNYPISPTPRPNSSWGDDYRYIMLKTYSSAAIPVNPLSDEIFAKMASDVSSIPCLEI